MKSKSNALRVLIFSFILICSAGTYAFTPKAEASFPFPWTIGQRIGMWGTRQIAYKIEGAVNKALDLVRTVINMSIAIGMDVPAYIAFQATPDQLSACYMIAPDIYGFLREGGGFVEGPYNLGDLPVTQARVAEGSLDGEVVEDALDTINAYINDGGSCNFNQTVGEGGGVSLGAGSLASVTASMREVTINEPLPVNMASFFYHYANVIPGVRNTAFAQDGVRYVTLIGSGTVFALWRITRNIALGLMSVLLLVIGMMIMTRKKISPQAVVTVQNALPRVALAIVLIFFSFPIGAFLASLILPLTLAGAQLLEAMMFESIIGDLSEVFLTGNNNLLMIMGMSIVYSLGVGFFAAIVGILSLFAYLVFLLIIYVKAVFIYVRVLFNIIFSPLQFALGALPGKESATLDWFKNMAVDVISVPAMFFMLTLGFVFLAIVTISAMTAPFTDAPTLDVIYRPFFVYMSPVVMLFCFMTALKMPGKVKGAVWGDKKR